LRFCAQYVHCHSVGDVAQNQKPKPGALRLKRKNK